MITARPFQGIVMLLSKLTAASVDGGASRPELLVPALLPAVTRRGDFRSNEPTAGAAVRRVACVRVASCRSPRQPLADLASQSECTAQLYR